MEGAEGEDLIEVPGADSAGTEGSGGSKTPDDQKPKERDTGLPEAETPVDEDSSDKAARGEETSGEERDKNQFLADFEQLLIGFGLSPERVKRITEHPDFNQATSWQELREVYEKRMEEIADSDSPQSALEAQIGGELVNLSSHEAKEVLEILREGDFDKAREQAVEFLTTKYVESQGEQRLSEEERMAIKTGLDSLFQAVKEIREETKEETDSGQRVQSSVEKLFAKTKKATEKLKPILQIAGIGSILLLILMIFKGFSASRQ